ncbi:bifunctional 2-polyprenyl-6-hydroxyphenol methylase/3-demethylubiquinol 3-O-methyltransferase UbiG [Dongia mobilis]|uniref:class I SAM-dependent methyltransferase n=1 Tax=Dongia sp. TaxID=1977262 RepID=UPI0026F206A2
MTTSPGSDALYHDPRLADFYDIDNGWADDTRMCLDLAREAGSVLDFGCGTGLLAAACAERGARVVGVDPAAAMLAIAAARPGGDRVTWVEGDGRTLRLDQRFDLIVMTGHAFQCLLTDADQLALLKTIAEHLAPQGRFIFDSRNPRGREWLEWGPHDSRRMVDHPRYGAVESWNDFAHDPATGIVTYDTYYRLPNGELLAAKSQIRFTSKEYIAALVDENGLTVDRWLGGWQGSDFVPESKEVIPLGRLK